MTENQEGIVQSLVHLFKTEEKEGIDGVTVFIFKNGKLHKYGFSHNDAEHEIKLIKEYCDKLENMIAILRKGKPLT